MKRWFFMVASRRPDLLGRLNCFSGPLFLAAYAFKDWSYGVQLRSIRSANPIHGRFCVRASDWTADGWCNAAHPEAKRRL